MSTGINVGVPITRKITVNGTQQDLSADRTFTVTDANLSTSDVTTNDVSITKHGFVPKAPNDTTKFLRGDGTWATAGGGLTIGTTAITSGTVGRVLFEGTGNVVQESANLFWDNTNGRLNIGAVSSNTARLDIKAQGALSTDIAFRVRNSADTANIVNFNGNGQFAIGQGATVNSTAFPEYSVVIGFNASDGAVANNTGSVAIGRLAVGNSNGVALGTQANSGTSGVSVGAQANSGNQCVAVGFQANATVFGVSIGKLATSTGTGAITIGTNTINNQNYGIVFNSSTQVVTNEHSNVCKMYFNSTKQSFFYHENGRFVINSKVDLVANTNYDNTATNTVTITSGTAPTLNIVDSFQQYSADITAGNAAPHFRTENGSIVKLYQETTGVAAATFVTNTSGILNDTATFDGYTIGQVVKALRNLGILQ